MNSSKCPPNVMLVFLAIMHPMDTEKYPNMVQAYNKGFNRTPVSSGPAKPGKLGGGAG